MNKLYRQKYLKYKAKYLELREQNGGIKPNTIHRFQNCAILKLTLKPHKLNATLELIYQVSKKYIKLYQKLCF